LDPYHIPVTQLAYGLPFGGDIDYTDELTLQKAFMGRTQV
jgi:recombination protein RecR